MKTAQQLVAEAKTRIQEVDIDQLEQALDSDALIIDTREPAEFSDHRIAQAINLPRGVLEFQLLNHPAVTAGDATPEATLEQLQQRPTYLICRSGGRSALAADSLQAMGLEKVYSVAGGMQAWANASKPMQK